MTESCVLFLLLYNNAEDAKAEVGSWRGGTEASTC